MDEELYYVETLPEITVTAKMSPDARERSRKKYQKYWQERRKQREQKEVKAMQEHVRSGTQTVANTLAKGAEFALDFTPFWWASPAVRTGLHLQNGNYGDAATEAGMAFLAPYAIGKGVQKIAPHILNGIKKFLKRTPDGSVIEVPQAEFKSELNWDPENWFGLRHDKNFTQKDVNVLKQHIPEYLEIERVNKENGTWLKMPDGTKWEGDPRSWVQLMSKNGQKMNPEILYSGVKVPVVDPEYNGIFWSTRAIDKNKSNLAAFQARAYAPSDDHVLQLVLPKQAKVYNFGDVLGKDWFNIPYKGRSRFTNDIVEDLFQGDIDVVKIDNVVDQGPKFTTIPKESKFQIFNNTSDQLNAAIKPLPQNDVIVAKNVPRKSIVGNNGNFDLNDKNIYKTVLFPIVGTSAYNAIQSQDKTVADNIK